MTENTMPAAEAAVAPVSSDDERGSYELAFHVLPTVAEGEVPTVFAAIKDSIIKAGGEIFDEETPERFDLAYEIVKHLEGKNRKFASAYFGWVRFYAPSEAVASLTAEVDARTDILRHLLLKLTKVEQEHPFRFHEALQGEKMVTTIDDAKEVTDAAAEEVTAEADAKTDKVDEAELDEALKSDEVK